MLYPAPYDDIVCDRAKRQDFEVDIEPDRSAQIVAKYAVAISIATVNALPPGLVHGVSTSKYGLWPDACAANAIDGKMNA